MAAVATASASGRQPGGPDAELAASRHWSCVVRPGDMHAAVAVSSTMTAARGFPTSMMALLLLLSLIAYVPVEALQCYDCLTFAVPTCVNGSQVRNMDKVSCKPDEIYCSVLVMNDSVGKLIVSRQCASRKDEGEQLMGYVAPSHDKPLKVVSFVTCSTDLCNIYDYIQHGASGLEKSMHDGGNSAGVSAANKPSNGSAGTLLAAPLAVLSVLAVGVVAVDILRPTA